MFLQMFSFVYKMPGTNQGQSSGQAIVKEVASNVFELNAIG